MESDLKWGRELGVITSPVAVLCVCFFLVVSLEQALVFRGHPLRLLNGDDEWRSTDFSPRPICSDSGVLNLVES